MKRWTKVSIWAIAFMIGLGLGIFLIQQGIDQAALWATVLGLPIAIIGTLAGVWSFVLAAKTIQESRQGPPDGTKPLKKANVELVDASIDPSISATLATSIDHALSELEQNHDNL